MASSFLAPVFPFFKQRKQVFPTPKIPRNSSLPYYLELHLAPSRGSTHTCCVPGKVRVNRKALGESRDEIIVLIEIIVTSVTRKVSLDMLVVFSEHSWSAESSWAA